MTNFYDPATSAVTGNGFFRLYFFTTAPDVRNISPLNYDLHCILFQLSYIMPICPGYDERERDATLFHQQMTLLPFFPLSVGFGPTVSWAKGALFMAPSILCHNQEMPSISSYSANPARHKAKNTPTFSHWRK